MECIHRQQRYGNLTKKATGQVHAIWHCAEREFCTETDIGLTLPSGEAMAVCERCPLFTAKPEPPPPLPMSPGLRLTVGMATYRDWPGVWATIQSIRLCHQECLPNIEIVVIDNDPEGRPDVVGEDNHSWKVKSLCDRIGARYEHFTAVAGTAAAKGRIFDLARAPAVLVIDCHVLLPAGALVRLIDHFAYYPESKDLWQGPCIGDGGYNDILGTHFAPRWGSLMYGQWEIDDRVYQSDDPFEIPMQGCGLFACKRAAWPGFHPLLRGFGPEEFHIHQRIRRNGGQCYCLPWLRWCHRFGNPDGTKPPGLEPTERLRGHLITHLDTGAPSLQEIRAHFVDETNAMTNEQFLRVLRDTVAEIFADRKDIGAECPHRQPFLRVVQCEIGCVYNRGTLPVFACAQFGECAKYRFERVETMRNCVDCMAEQNQSLNSGQESGG